MGYAAAYSADPVLDLQFVALTKFGLDRSKIYTDQRGNLSLERPGLRRALKATKRGDALVVLSLKHLGSSIYEIAKSVERMARLGVNLVSITDDIDGRTPTGNVAALTLAAMAKLERDLIIERTKAGQAASKERGRKPGRRETMTAEIEGMAEALLIESPPLAMNEIAERLKPWISRTKFFSWKKKRDELLSVERTKKND